MSGKLTPGPWCLLPVDANDSNMAVIVGANGQRVCDFGNDEQYYPTEGVEPSDEDMRLILAAPDLLAAALQATVWIKQVMAEKGWHQDRIDNPPSGSHLYNLYAAIAKASPTTTDAGVVG